MRAAVLRFPTTSDPGRHWFILLTDNDQHVLPDATMCADRAQLEARQRENPGSRIREIVTP